MFCPNCGKPIQEGISYCDNCGHRISPSKEILNPPVSFGEAGKETNTIVTTKRKKSNNYLLPIIGLCIIGFIYFKGCSNHLSNSKAKNLIIEWLNNNGKTLPIAASEGFIKTYLYEYNSQNSGGFIPTHSICIGEKYADHQSLLDLFKSKDLITVSFSEDGGCTLANVSLTNKGQQYFIGNGKTDITAYNVYDTYVVKTFEYNFGEITGIREIKEANTAEVEFTLKQENITPFGECYNTNTNETKNVTAEFQLYNDGWRVTQVNGI